MKTCIPHVAPLTPNGCEGVSKLGSVFATVVIGRDQLPILSYGECGFKVIQSGW